MRYLIKYKYGGSDILTGTSFFTFEQDTVYTDVQKHIA